jgi:hypothetical protein
MPQRDTYSRTNISRPGLSRGDEESKIDRKKPQESPKLPQITPEPSTKILTTHTYQKSGLGDFTGNIRDFQKPREDKVSSSSYMLKKDEMDETPKSNLVSDNSTIGRSI